MDILFCILYKTPREDVQEVHKNSRQNAFANLPMLMILLALKSEYHGRVTRVSLQVTVTLLHASS